MLVRLLCLVVVLVASLWAGEFALAQDGQPIDPFVALDNAKSVLSDGKLEDAREKLGQIPAGQAEAYVDEEVVFQRILLESAFLDAANFLYTELGKMKLESGGYGKWLWTERDKFASNLATYVRQYMRLTEGGHQLTFIRFRLPEVSDKHIQDVELYSDRQVLAAAAQNWDEGREGLGKGLILAQVRVAVALSAAGFYDKPRGGSLAQVTQRLKAGVPVYPTLTMDWIADTCKRLEGAGNGLGQLSKAADDRLHRLLAANADPQLSARREARLAPPKPIVAPTQNTKPKKASGKKRRGKRRR